ncbi:MAG: hypothetical protein WCQ99_01055 [Pseudomonadota bacterium]
MIRRILTILTIIFCFLLKAPLCFSLEVQPGQGKHGKFSRSETIWAVQWINNGLSLFMEKGFVKKITAKDDAFEVYAGKPWYTLEITQQGAFLQNLSRAREITGHSPFFTVFDVETSATVARVTETAIEILSPDEGFKNYQPASEVEKNTLY